jgi:hypothetical protein
MIKNVAHRQAECGIGLAFIARTDFMSKGPSWRKIMDADRFLSILPEFEVVAVSKESLYMAQQLVTGCEACDSKASRSFSSVLDDVMGRTDRLTNYIVCEPANCTRCGAAIVETTLVHPEDPAAATIDFDVPTELTDIRLIDEALLRDAEGWVVSCENCSLQTAEYSFDQILDSLTGSDPTKTEYVLCREAICPRCHNGIKERTLVCPV